MFALEAQDAFQRSRQQLCLPPLGPLSPPGPKSSSPSPEHPPSLAPKTSPGPLSPKSWHTFLPAPAASQQSPKGTVQPLGTLPHTVNIFIQVKSD